METKLTNIERKYKLLARASRNTRLKKIEEMGPTVSGVKRIQLIPPYSMRSSSSSSMIKAYTKIHDAVKASSDSTRFK